MSNYKSAYLAHMDSEGIKYTERDENSVVVSYGGDNMQSIRITVIFDKDGGNQVHFVNWDIGNYKDKVAKALVICNAMNKRWKWAKFYIDDDYDVTVDSDALVSADSVGPECMEMVVRLVDIIDKSYPEFMKAKWA